MRGGRCHFLKCSFRSFPILTAPIHPSVPCRDSIFRDIRSNQCRNENLRVSRLYLTRYRYLHNIIYMRIWREHLPTAPPTFAFYYILRHLLVLTFILNGNKSMLNFRISLATLMGSISTLLLSRMKKSVHSTLI